MFCNYKQGGFLCLLPSVSKVSVYIVLLLLNCDYLDVFSCFTRLLQFQVVPLLGCCGVGIYKKSQYLVFQIH